MAVAGTGDWIVRSDNVRLDINSAGTIAYGGAPIPGSAGSYAVGYDPSSNGTYKQASADRAVALLGRQHDGRHRLAHAGHALDAACEAG